MNFKIFDGIDEKNLNDFKKLTSFSTKKYYKGEQIICNNSKVSKIYLIEDGNINIVRFDIWGNRFIIGNFGSGSIFAESYALSDHPAEVDVFASTNAIISSFSTKNIVQIANISGCSKIIENLMLGITEKNHILSKRLHLVTQKSVKQRLLLYLSNLANASGKMSFNLPLSRQDLADYLNVDRTGLYNIMKSLEKDGIISVKNRNIKIFNLEEKDGRQLL